MACRSSEEAQVFALVLGRVIVHFRERRRWTQDQLASAVGVSQPSVSRIEAGKGQPDAFLYGRFAAALGVTVDQLARSVNGALAATKRAAGAVGKNSWESVLAHVGMQAIGGLVVFVVGVMFAKQEQKS